MKSVETITQKQGMQLLEKVMLKPKRKLSLWDFTFVKFGIRMGRRNRDDTKKHVKCVRCEKEIIYGLEIELCRYCYEQTERDCLPNGNSTLLEGMVAELLKKEQCVICGKVTKTRWLSHKEHCMKCFRDRL